MTTLSTLDIDMRRVTPITAARSFGKPITDEMRIETMVEKRLAGFEHSVVCQGKARGVRLLHSGYSMNEALRRVDAWARNVFDPNDNEPRSA